MSAEKRVVLITGGATGIGAATARKAAAAGWAVGINYRSQRDKAEALAAEIGGSGGKAVAIAGDVADPAGVEAIFAASDKAFGRLDALVNSAGAYAGGTTVAHYDAQVLTRLMATNVVGLMLCCREGVRRMSTASGGRGGVIVNISSMAALSGGRGGSSHYAASKGAVDAFSIGLALEVGREGIRVNVVRPGFTRTELVSGVLANPGTEAALSATIPLGRIAEADEVAQPIVWLLSNEASFVSGAFLNVSGGGFVIGGISPPR